MYLVLLKDNKPIWLVHPASDFGKEYPEKGISTGLGSVLIRAPYESGIIGYYGLFEDYNAIGEHRIYLPTGILKFSINYDSNILIEFDSLGNKIREDLDYKTQLQSEKLNGTSSLLLRGTELLKMNE